MRSKSSLYFVFFAIFALVLGAVLKSWIFLIASIANIAILAVSLRGLPPEDIDLEVSRGSEEMDIYEEDEVWLELELKNKGDDLAFIEVLDVLPSSVEVLKGSNHQVLELKSGEKKKIRYKLGCPLRGELDVGPIKFRYRDSLGLFYKEWEEENSVKIHVLPRMEKMKNVNIRPSYTRNWLGNIRSSNIGIGTEFYSIREYVPGDEIRDINWKATAKHLNPMTNEFEGERSGDVIIVLDGYKAGNVGTRRYNTTTASARAAASIASTILEDRNRVGLVVLGDYLNWVYPGAGREQFYKIMDNLSRLQEGGTWKFEDAKWLIKRFFPNRSMIIFISPLIQDKVTDTIIDMCMKEFDVMVISPNPVKLEKQLDEDYKPTAESILNMERKTLIERLWRYAMVVDWDPNEPLEAALNEVLRYQKRRRSM